MFQLRQNIDLNSILANDLKKIYLNYTVFEDTGNKPPKIVCSFPMCFIDIGIQQIHSIFVRSVTYSNVTLNDRMNEHIHIKNVSELSSLSHNTRTARSLILMSKQRAYIGPVLLREFSLSHSHSLPFSP